ncbi:MAG: ABC transporter ATP-binding protein [Candidatus Aureabacteria bacterium]|nr:ABC transporter ATP-binding protein [Candidatus Auribacterota bacterium]
MKTEREKILEVKDLHTYFCDERAFPVKAVEGLTFHLLKGEVLGIVGESGCGKSLTALSVLQILPPGAKIVKGEILFKGKDLIGLSQKQLNTIRGTKISMIFQEPSSYLNPVLSVGYQVAEALSAHTGQSIRDAMKKARQMFKEVGIPDPEQRVHNYPHEMSGGQKQRVMTAMALINEPDIIIADEPTTSLDVTVQAQIINLFKKLLKDHSSSIVFISHDLPLVSEIADRIIVMYAGMNFEEAPVDVLIKDPKHPYTKKLLESIPKESSSWQKMKTIPGAVPDPARKPGGCPFHPRCDYAEKDCNQRIPFMTQVDDTHFTACYHYEKIKNSNKQNI